MPERLEKLLATLRELETELSAVDSLDPGTREVLESAVEDIQQALQRPGGQPSEADGDQGLQQRLEKSLQDFEASHPGLASLLSRIIDLLGQVGI